MKDSMTGFDVRAVSLELDAWSGAYVKKAYMPHYEQIVLRINPKESEQFDLVIVRGQRVYTSKRDRPNADDASIVRNGSKKTSQKCSTDQGGAGWL